MQRLWKKRYGNRGGGDKFYIDCSRYAENPNSFEIQSLIRHTSNTYVTILEAVAKDKTIQDKHRNNIVVKIGPSDDITKKEYQIGEYLKNLNGFITPFRISDAQRRPPFPFITAHEVGVFSEAKHEKRCKYICLFHCFDDTSNKLKNTKTRKNHSEENPVLPKEIKICDAVKKQENIKDVLVMPYIKEGSIEKYNWTTENIDILKNTMIHIVLSMAMAFNNMGFIHRDLHLGNVLLTKTVVEELEYILDKEKNIIIREPTMGYKIVIMDFEKAELNINDIYFFWDDLYRVLKDIDGKDNNNNEKVYWKEEHNILSFIKDKRENREPLHNILELIDHIKNSSIVMKDKNPPLTYNPNNNFVFLK